MRRSWLAGVSTLLLLLGSAGYPVSQAALSDASTERVIVVFNDDVGNPAQAAAELAARHRADVGFVYEHALKGFSAELPASAVAGISRDPRVAYVETDQIATTFAQETPTGIERIFADDNPNLTIDGVDDYRIDVDVAVIDTGIDLDHPDLNVVASVNCSGGSPFKGKCGNGGDDDNGHGTHVAGTIGALDNDFGVVGDAPGARLWAVKVLRSNGSGYISWIVAGIDYVTANADQIEVANMSLGCECSSSAMDTAIANSVAAGVTYAVAAGNSAKDASTFSPANHPDVITVSALADFDGAPGGLAAATCRSDQDDTLADFSNFGSSVEITAPGVCILSTVPGGYDTFSGTSMASPHAAGAAAILAASGISNPADIRTTLINKGNLVWTDDSGDGIQEPLLDVSDTTVFAPATVPGDGAPPPPDTTAPAAPTGLTATAGDTQVSLDWGDNVEPDLASYKVYQSTTIGGPYTEVATTTVSDYTDTGLTNDTTYYYVVTALDSSGNESTYSAETSATPSAPAPDTTAPAAPTGLTATAGDTQVDLDWADNTEDDLASYKVYQSTTIGGPYTEVATTTVSDYTDTGLTNDTTYYYVVTALDTSDNESPASSEASAIPQAGATTTIHVGDLDGVVKIKGKSGKWEALVTVTVHDAADSLVAGATVSGTWTGDASGTISGITGADGTVTLGTGNLTAGTEVIFTVDNVTGDGLSYDGTANHDPDIDSDGTTITIVK